MMRWDELIIKQSDDRKLAESVVNSLNRLILEDLHLLHIDVNERAITHRLGMYLQSELSDWDVDCEYNRSRHNPKYLMPDVIGVSSDDTQGNTVYPDIIVHIRGEEKNYLVIEVKKSSNTIKDDEDLDKLRRFQEQLGYKHALFLRIGVGTDAAGDLKAHWVKLRNE